jgi:hypothetical protein
MKDFSHCIGIIDTTRNVQVDSPSNIQQLKKDLNLPETALDTQAVRYILP